MIIIYTFKYTATNEENFQKRADKMAQKVFTVRAAKWKINRFPSAIMATYTCGKCRNYNKKREAKPDANNVVVSPCGWCSVYNVFQNNAETIVYAKNFGEATKKYSIQYIPTKKAFAKAS